MRERTNKKKWQIISTTGEEKKRKVSERVRQQERGVESQIKGIRLLNRP